MRNYSVLICDDNIAVHKSIGAYLEEEGIGVFSVYDGESAITALRDNSIDLVILDIMLPGQSGMQVCREIRKNSDIFCTCLLEAETVRSWHIRLEIVAIVLNYCYFYAVSF